MRLFFDDFKTWRLVKKNYHQCIVKVEQILHIKFIIFSKISVPTYLIFCFHHCKQYYNKVSESQTNSKL